MSILEDNDQMPTTIFPIEILCFVAANKLIEINTKFEGNRHHFIGAAPWEMVFGHAMMHATLNIRSFFADMRSCYVDYFQVPPSWPVCKGVNTSA